MDLISIVIPTQSRAAALSRTLSALAAQELGDRDAEIVIVCSDSSRRYRDEVASLASSLPWPAKVLSRSGGGAGGARNTGVRAAEGELILFLNDDTPPLTSDLVRSHAVLHARATAWEGVLGRVVWDPEVETTPVMDWLTRTGKMNDYDEGILRAPMLYAPNFSLRKFVFLEVDGFDERFWRYGWEEYDLALRLGDRGFSTRFAPDLVVGHHHRYTTRESLRRMEAVGAGAHLFNLVHESRPRLVTPVPAGTKARAARILAPVAAHMGVPGWLPQRVRDAIFRALHYSALAKGYANGPTPDDPPPAGGIPALAERTS